MNTSTMTRPPLRIALRPVDPRCDADIEWVAQGMRQTLIEVEGEAVGTALYDMDWLRARVRWHLDPAQCAGAVLLAEDVDGHIVGHTLLRIEPADAEWPRHGLFSTTFVAPAARRGGIATQLLQAGEDWMRARRLPEAATWTSATNAKLIALFAGHHYVITARHVHEVTQTEMVRLSRVLART